MTDHDHDYGPVGKRGAVGFCRGQAAGLLDCSAMAVSTGKRWRPPTVEEQLAVTEHQMWAIAVAQAGMIIHGRERGIAWARQALGYGPGDKA